MSIKPLLNVLSENNNQLQSYRLQMESDVKLYNTNMGHCDDVLFQQNGSIRPYYITMEPDIRMSSDWRWARFLRYRYLTKPRVKGGGGGCWV